MSDKEALEDDLRQGIVTACVPYADLLAEEGHPYAEELCLAAEVAVGVPSQSRAIIACATLLRVAELTKNPENDQSVSRSIELLRLLID